MHRDAVSQHMIAMIASARAALPSSAHYYNGTMVTVKRTAHMAPPLSAYVSIEDEGTKRGTAHPAGALAISEGMQGDYVTYE
eukprot:scaffold103432_cov19-Tisochrysis_lutea.AAC.2